MTHEYKSDWALCPADVLLMVFKKLDINSLINCMNVNIHWRNLVEYYCEHLKLWRAMVQNTIDDEGVKFAEKTKLGWREQLLSAQRWLNVGNCVNVHLRRHYKFDHSIRNIHVYKDNLIVVTNIAVKYFNIENFELIKVIDKTCIKYEETSSMIVELSTAIKHKFVLILTNKLYENCADSDKVQKITPKSLDSFKVHLNSCYEYKNNVLWVYTATETGWETNAVAKYYGIHQFCSIHIFKNDLYVLLKSGDVLILHKEWRLFAVVFHFDIPKLDQKSQPFMFHIYSLLFKAPELDLDLSDLFRRRRQDFMMTVARYGVTPVTCVLEHGHILIVGFEDGKIDIYLIRKFNEPSEDIPDLPDLTLNLKKYLDTTNLSESHLSISSLDMYEDMAGHHLFVSTKSSVYELLL